MTYEAFWFPLSKLYPAGEAKAIALMVLELKYGMSLSDVLCGKMEQLAEQELLAIQSRLLTGEPVQYIIGEAEFGGRRFVVSPSVLIPRPETYELCQWALEHGNPQQVVDICTGSGCIACTIAAERPDAEVWGWDISEPALRVAEENGRRLNVQVTFEKRDALQLFNLSPFTFNLIISNPPYITDKERVTIDRNVLDFEPDIALFVPNDDPLLFYRHIATFAMKALTDDGWLLFEINPLYAYELTTLLQDIGFREIALRHDQFGKERFIRACR